MLTHPSFRTDEDLMQHVKGLGLYQRAIARRSWQAGQPEDQEAKGQEAEASQASPGPGVPGSFGRGRLCGEEAEADASQHSEEQQGRQAARQDK